MGNKKLKVNNILVIIIVFIFGLLMFSSLSRNGFKNKKSNLYLSSNTKLIKVLYIIK